MERIVIEVDKRIAKAWRNASEKTKKEIGNRINISLAKELMRPTSGRDENEYLEFLNGLRKEMQEMGLTQEKLNEILKDA